MILKIETYGFKSKKCPLAVKELLDFEEDLKLMIRNIQYKNIKKKFSNKLADDVKLIKSAKELFVNAHKSRNIYKLDEAVYKKYLVENIRKTYQKPTKARLKSINKTTKKFAEKLKIAGRMEFMDESEAYVTIKDHKENFPEKPSFRLINPSKSDIEKISKRILHQINENISQNTNVNQWKNSTSVIDWFKAIYNKSQYTFIFLTLKAFINPYH